MLRGGGDANFSSVILSATCVDVGTAFHTVKIHTNFKSTLTATPEHHQKTTSTATREYHQNGPAVD